jgi:hypothetical protein
MTHSVSCFFGLFLFIKTPHCFATRNDVPLGQAPSFEFLLSQDDDSRHAKVRLIAYNKKLYELAYKVYLQNQNPKKAYLIATAAVKQNPESKIWRQRLAQVAIWNQEPTVALEQYFYLYQQFNDVDAQLQGLELSKKMLNDAKVIQFLSMDIKKGTMTETHWKVYFKSMFRMGEVEQLEQVINNNRDKMPVTLYLDTLSRIYKLNDDPDAQLKVLNELSLVSGMQPDIAEQIAEIYFNRGNFVEAARVLAQASKNAGFENQSFWSADVFAAYNVQDSKEELTALQHLLEQKKPDEAVFSRLIELTREKQPTLAYQYALEGRKLYPDSFSIALNALFLLTNSQFSRHFPQICSSTPPALLKTLKMETTYWDAQAAYSKQLRNYPALFKTYWETIQRFPNNDFAKASLIGFLIEFQQSQLLKRLLALWQSDLPAKPNLWTAYSMAYAHLGDLFRSRLVLSLFYDEFKTYENNPYWLIAFKDALENSFFYGAANAVNHYAWPIYLELLRKQKQEPDLMQTVNYVKLSLLNAPGDATAVALSLLQTHESEDVELLMLSWALGHRNITLARAVYSYFKAQGMLPPLWVDLSIALERNDRQGIQKILKDPREIVSYRDTISGATAIDALPLAENLAYNALKRNRKDDDLYDNFFTPLMLKNSNNFYFSQEYFQYGNVAGPRNQVSYTYFLMPSLSVTPYNSAWFSHNIPGEVNPTNNGLNANNQVFETVPSLDERAGVKFETKQRRGYLTLDLGYRDNLTSFMTGKLSRTYQAWSKLDLSSALGYNQPADDTAGLLIAGMKDELEFGFNYQLLAKDSILGLFSQGIFYTQDRQYLADGSQFTLRYEHKFWRSYPDWTLSPYGVVTQYYNRTRLVLRGNVLKIIPVGLPPTVNFLIPESFYEAGLTLAFGQKYTDEYTHRWRPFALLTLSNNTVVGPGQLYNLSIAGAVFGRDHLLIYYEYGTNQGQGLQAQRLFKVSYRIYS